VVVVVSVVEMEVSEDDSRGGDVGVMEMSELVEISVLELLGLDELRLGSSLPTRMPATLPTRPGTNDCGASLR